LDYILNIAFLLTFWAASLNYIEAYGGVIKLSDLIQNILICVQKIKESLTGLEQHEGE